MSVNGSGAADKVYLDHNPKSVALVAMGPSVVDFIAATFTQELSPGWVDEVWAVNMASNGIEHDVVFWMDDLIAQNEFKPGLMGLLRKRGKPVITTDRRPEIVPNSYDFPVQEVAKIGFDIFGKPYLNNGVAMAIAYAIWKDVKRLLLFGCDFTYPDRSYAEPGRACLEAWVTVALSKGMDVQLSGTTSLFDVVRDGGIYGYREQPLLKLPDGREFRYQKAGVQPGYKTDALSGYVPETSRMPVMDGKDAQAGA